MLSVAGIAVGVLSLISVIGVMNGFQLGFIEDILEISSYHIRLTADDPSYFLSDIQSLQEIPGVKSVVPFTELQALIENDFNEMKPVLLRGIHEDAPELDPDFAAQIEMREGDFDISEDWTIVLGGELAGRMGKDVGDSINLILLEGEDFSVLKPREYTFRISGLYSSGYYEFDSALCFISLDSAEIITGTKSGIVFGIKLENRFQDSRGMYNIRTFIRNRDFSLESWREYNKSFFSALKMEKLVMSLLLSLIFIVVGVNIFHSLRRTIYEKTEEIGILKSLGSTGKDLRTIFILEGMFIGTIGGTAGLVCGMLVTGNINRIFRFAENAVNFVVSFISMIAAPLTGAGDFSLFSPRYYYLMEVPTAVLFREVLFVVTFAIVISTFSAYFASKRITEIKPSEVLRYE